MGEGKTDSAAHGRDLPQAAAGRLRRTCRGILSPVIRLPSGFSPASTARLDEASSSKSDSIEANLLVIAGE
jgi:hypothetical protein